MHLTAPKRRGVEELFEVTASRFGTTVDRLRKPGNNRDAAQVAANVASFIAFMEGCTNTEIAHYIGRSPKAVSWMHTRIRNRPEQLRLAWGIWLQLGGTWAKFAEFSYLTEQPDIPADTEYLARGVGGGVAGSNRPPQFLNSGVALSKRAIEYLGLDVVYRDERGVSQAVLKQAIEDLLVGCDATRWIQDTREHVEGAITFDAAATACGMDPAWLRKQVLQAARRIVEGKEGIEWV